jgi:hypothetical protein
MPQFQECLSPVQTVLQVRYQETNMLLNVKQSSEFHKSICALKQFQGVDVSQTLASVLMKQL